MTEIKRTTTEIAREQQRETVCRMWRQYREVYPSASPHRIMETIADDQGLTVPGVRGILIRNGLYESRNAG